VLAKQTDALRASYLCYLGSKHLIRIPFSCLVGKLKFIASQTGQRYRKQTVSAKARRVSGEAFTLSILS
jgi:hypothetical protein